MSVRRSTAEFARADAPTHLLAARAVTTPFTPSVSPPIVDRGVREEDVRVLFVRGNISLRAVPTLRDQFCDAILGMPGAVVLDCSATTGVDRSAIELLVELRHALCGRGDHLELRDLGPSEARAIDELGLTAILGTERFVPTQQIPSIG